MENGQSGNLSRCLRFFRSREGNGNEGAYLKYENYALSISATTRAPREGEENGREYFFKTREEFEEMIREDQLVEYAQYVENYYGTPKKYVFDNIEAGKDVLLEIEIQGALKVKEKFPERCWCLSCPPAQKN